MRNHVRLAGGALALGLALAGCAGLRTERQGRDTGRAICDIKSADSADAARQALDKANQHFDKAKTITGRRVDDDVRNVQNNLNDLVNHVGDGQKTLAQQDIAAINRNVQQAVDTTTGLTRRYYQGVAEGLGDCT